MAAAKASAASAPLSTSAVRGRLIGGERVERVVQWPTSPPDARARAGLQAATLAAIERSPVPVLTPGTGGWDEPMIASPRGRKGPGFGYALSTHAGGRTLSLHGSRVATLIPGIGRHAGPERLRGTDGFITDNDGVKSATWIEHGVAYALDVECEDRRARGCDVPALRAEVEALVYVGGAGQQGGVP